MADISAVRCKHATLVANVVDRVQLTFGPGQARVVNRGALGALFVRADETDPTVGGDDTFAVPNNSEKIIPNLDPAWTWRIISTAASPYSVEGV